MAVQKNPIRQTVKAGKRVGKALSAFEKAASELERASAEHLAVADLLDDQRETLVESAYQARTRAILNADAALDAALEAGRDLDALASANEDSAYVAQLQADNLRNLLTVV